MNYARVFSRQIKRALRQVGGDLELLFDRAEDLGFESRTLEEGLISDLESDGPIFGRFFENIMGAAEQSIAAAQRQGIAVGEAFEINGRLVGGGERLTAGETKLADALGDLSDEDWQRLTDGSDPDAMDAFERNVLDDQPYTWIATLEKTCQYCLPLHGSTQLRSEWRAQALDPETIHQDNGFNSRCKCTLLLATEPKTAESAAQLEPLRRETIETKKGLRGNKRTQRAVLQTNVRKAQAAADRAQRTQSGRRTMRELGKVNADVET